MQLWVSLDMAQQEQKLFLEKESSNEVFVKLAGLPDPIDRN